MTLSLTDTSSTIDADVAQQSVAANIYLVRYGAVPEVARFVDASKAKPQRGEMVVVQTHRGLQLGTVLERLKPAGIPKEIEIDFEIVRVATPADLTAAHSLSGECEEAFSSWCARILQWDLQLELIDLEWTLDRQKLILYVLCERGPDSTKLALQAAAAGLGIIEVQPVSATGLVSLPQEKSCGSGGDGCGCSH